MVKQLSPSLQRTLLAIHQLQVKKGYIPTLREVADRLNYSPSAIQYQVNELIGLGYLDNSVAGKERSTPRSMRFGQSLDYQGKTIPVLGVCN